MTSEEKSIISTALKSEIVRMDMRIEKTPANDAMRNVLIKNRGKMQAIFEKVPKFDTCY